MLSATRSQGERTLVCGRYVEVRNHHIQRTTLRGTQTRIVMVARGPSFWWLPPSKLVP